MSDPLSGIRPVGPTYPVKPVRPVPKDRAPGERDKEERRKPTDEERHDDDPDKPIIDEHV